MIDWIQFANAFAEWAKTGDRGVCKAIAANYAHVTRKPTIDVLTALSVSLMNSTGFEYEEYNAIRNTITDLMREAR